MQHLGDITQLSGESAPVTDCVIGGSPCQDLSIAGARKGLSGERSGLFVEQIRIIKEMREHDKKTGRTGQDIRPRFMVWENVPGAFSSNKGEDFRVVLEKTAQIADETVLIPRLANGKWSNAGCIVADGWSLAWRVLDAQFWGVSQRRRRIALVADFGGRRAPEILFESKSLSGYIAESGETRQEIAGSIGTSVNSAEPAPNGTTGRNGLTVPANEPIAFHLTQDPICSVNHTPCLSVGSPKGQATVGVCVPIHDKATRCKGGGATRNNDGAGNGLGVGEDGSPMYTLTAADRHAVAVHQNASGECRLNPVANTLCSNSNASGRNAPLVLVETLYPGVVGTLCASGAGLNRPAGMGGEADLCVVQKISRTGVKDLTPWETQTNRIYDASGVFPALCSRERSGMDRQAVLCMAHSTPHAEICKDCAPTLTCRHEQPSVMLPEPETKTIVRRLTPLECERLQGYPDKWTDIGAWTDSKGKLHKESSDNARYKALGNSIALPPWRWILTRLCACYDRPATLASLFDGISGFCLLWAQLNGIDSVKWCSEIEEFPIAVCKRHFGDEKTGKKGDLSEIFF